MTTPSTSPLPPVLEGRPLVVVDIEGNGGQPPRIVEIAVLTVDGPVTGQEVRTWLVKPAEPITTHARRVHGIDNRDVETAPPWQTAAGEVAPLLAERVLLAHNAATEYRVLGAHLPDWRPLMVLDTLRLARHVWPGLPGYGLGELVAHARLDVGGVAGQRPHRAGYDAWCTWLLFLALLDDSGLDWDGLVRTAALKEFQPSEESGEGLW